jgi:nucleotide-binding universal stress UspA family protein
VYRHILVPVDDSLLSIETTSKAVAFAKATGARITFFHARADFGATDAAPWSGSCHRVRKAFNERGLAADR